MGGAEAAAEQEMEENMQSVGGMLANLRNMALDMNAEIRDQNEQMDRIAEKAASDQGQVARANQAAAEILKQWKLNKQLKLHIHNCHVLKSKQWKFNKS